MYVHLYESSYNLQIPVTNIVLNSSWKVVSSELEQV